MSHDNFTAVLMTWYRNNVLHVLAAPSFIACLIVNRRIGIRRVDARRLFRAVYPYVEKELQADGRDDPDRWLEHLLAAKLVEQRGNAFVAPPRPGVAFSPASAGQRRHAGAGAFLYFHGAASSCRLR